MMHAHRAAKRVGDAERGDMRSGEEKTGLALLDSERG
jgi:hypothetical protein